VRRDEGIARRVREERRLAVERDEDRIGDDARQERGDERVRFEIVAVENFDAQGRQKVSLSALNAG